MSKPALLALATLVVYALHQDVWLWRTARPFLLGFLPAGLAYHLGYCVLGALLMGLLVKHAWPEKLERAAERHEEREP